MPAYSLRPSAVDIVRKNKDHKVMKQISVQFPPVFYTGSPAVG